MAESEPQFFAGSVRKVERAESHLRALNAEIKPFIHSEPQPFRVASKVEVDSSRYLARILIERELPPEWSLIVGDFVQNLRAALDHLVCRLIYAKGQEPTKRHAFPIFDRPPSGKSRRRWNAMLADLDSAAIHFIESCQPYHGPDGPSRHILSALRELSNEDKHRLLLPSVASIAEPQSTVIDLAAINDVGDLGRGQLYVNRPLKHGDLVLEAPVEITGPNPEVKLQTEIPLDVGFGRAPHIVPTKGLAQMLHAVGQTVMTAERALG